MRRAPAAGLLQPPLRRSAGLPEKKSKRLSFDTFMLHAQLMFHVHANEEQAAFKTLEQGAARGVHLALVVDYDGRTALHLAACEGLLEMGTLLIQEGSSINAVDRWGHTPLDEAIINRQQAFASMLREHGAEVTPVDGSRSETRRSVSVVESEEDTVAPLRDLGIAPRERGSPSLRRSRSDPVATYAEKLAAQTLVSGDIWAATAFGSTNTVMELLRTKVDINKRDYDKRTALHAAAALGRVNIVECLLKNKADANVIDRWDQTPLDEAINNGQHKVQTLLLEHGALSGTSVEMDVLAPPLGNVPRSASKASKLTLPGISALTKSPSIQDMKDFSAGHDLCLAAADRNMAKIQKLLQRGIDVNTPNYDRRTALHLAAAYGQLDVISFLLSARADVNMTDRWSRTPLDDAVAENKKEAVQLLRTCGATQSESAVLEAKERQGYILCQAAREGNVAALRDLLESGVQVDQRDYDSRTALHLAASEGQLAAVQFLISQRASPNSRDRWDFTPLQDAIRGKKNIEVIKLLEAKGGRVYENGALMPLSQSSCLQEGHWTIRPDEVVRQKGPILGKGAYGEVYLGRWRGTVVAVKILRGDLAQKNMDIKAVLNDFRLEVAVMRQLNHPNIVQFFGAHLKPPLMLITEYMPGGSLTTVMKQYRTQGRPMPPKLALRYASHMARGLSYLHTHKPPIIHRDLKPSNLIIDRSGNLKLTDFGLAKVLKPYFKPEEYNMTGETGSYRYMAPEVFRHELYTEKVDQYSFGIILWEMLEGRTAFGDRRAINAAHAAEQGRRPMFSEEVEADVSSKGRRAQSGDSRRGDSLPRYWPGVKKLISMCWDDDPARRPTFEALCEALDRIRDWPNQKQYEGALALEAEARDRQKGCVLN